MQSNTSNSTNLCSLFLERSEKRREVDIIQLFGEPSNFKKGGNNPDPVCCHLYQLLMQDILLEQEGSVAVVRSLMNKFRSSFSRQNSGAAPRLRHRFTMRQVEARHS